MTKRVLTVDSLIGGEGEDKKVGVANGFYRSKNIDFRGKASRFSLNPKTVKESGATVDTPVRDMARVTDGTVFMMGETKIYRRNREAQGGTGSYTAIVTTGLTNADSAVYNKDRDKIYIPDGANIHTIENPDSATTSSDFNADQIGQVLDYEVNASPSNTYAVPTAISETDANKLEWQPEIEPLIKIAVWVVAKGTGNLTITVHDAADNELASEVIANGSLTTGAWNEFELSAQVRQYVKPGARTYHIHATSDTASQVTLKVATTNDLSTAEVQTYADRLVDGVFHPISQQAQFLAIGNERYVSIWEPITDDPSKQEFEQHRLKLPPEYTVIGITEWEEMTVVSAKKSVSSDYGDEEWGIDSNEGLLLFWDRVADTYNWFLKVNDGAYESIYSAGGLLYGIVNGVLHVSNGGLPVPLKTLPGVEDFTSENDQHDDDVYLQAPYKGMTIKRNLLHLGFPMLTVNDSIRPGMYSFGTKNVQYPESFGHTAAPSHGDDSPEYDTGDTPDTPLSGVTFVGRFGANLFMAWTHGASDVQTFGVDVIRENHDPFTTGYVELFEFDDGLPHKEKQASEIHVTYEQLPTDTTIVPSFKVDHEATWQDGVATNSITHEPQNKRFVLQIDEKQYHTIDIRVDLTGNANGSPIVKSIEHIFDDQTQEKL